MKKKMDIRFVDKRKRDLAYLYLPNHPGRGKGSVAQSMRLAELLDYDGPDFIFDFDASGRLIGVEIDADCEPLHKGPPVVRPA